MDMYRVNLLVRLVPRPGVSLLRPFTSKLNEVQRHPPLKR